MTNKSPTTLISLCIAFAIVVVGQSADSLSQQTTQQSNIGGWPVVQDSIATNQPASIAPARQAWTPPNSFVNSLPNLQSDSQRMPLDSISDQVRQQIGLANLEEPISDESPTNSTGTSGSIADLFSSQTESLTSRDGIGSSIKVALLLAALSLAPAIVLMTTCYIRVIVVLTLLKQAFGAQQLPPTQVLTALAFFVTLLVMTPVWNEVKTTAIDPYQAENGISWDEALERGIVPVKEFMAKQIDSAGNGESIAMFYRYLPDHQTMAPPKNAQEVPINVLLPAFMVSELKVAFLLGFQIYLPFLVLDLVVSSVTVSTGMLMLPPTMVSFPLKLILFVLVDGWNLVIGMLLQSFQTFT